MPDPDDDQTEDPTGKDLVMGICRNAEEELPGPDDLARMRVIFVPSAGLNWEPVYTHADRADVFVYADEAIDKSHCLDAIRGIGWEAVETTPGAAWDAYRSAAMMANLPCADPWVRAARITAQAGQTTRVVWLIVSG
jgi:hypothetical protein